MTEEDARSYQNQDGYRLSGETKIAIRPSVDFSTLSSYRRLEALDQTEGDRNATAVPVAPPTSSANSMLFPGEPATPAPPFVTFH